jgi:adenylosuccinate synthase
MGDTVDYINSTMCDGETVLCEMTQGFDLCLEHGIDPHYCTSKMVNPAMALAEAGVPAQRLGDVYGVLRPYPIRVNNREGSSGPYADAPEITWKMVADRSGTPGDMTELTTTTKLPRRVFEFSVERFAKFVQICCPTILCLQFANYVDHSIYQSKNNITIPILVKNFIKRLEDLADVPVGYIGTGPDHEDMIDCDQDDSL